MKLIDAEYALATSISGLIRTIEGEPWIRVKEVRDSLKNVPTFDIDNIITEHENIGYEQGFRDGYAEAVDTKPVRHGHWVKMSDADGFYYCCSECGEELYRKWTFDSEFDIFPKKRTVDKTQYCPHCGAKMDLNEVKDNGT